MWYPPHLTCLCRFEAPWHPAWVPSLRRNLLHCPWCRDKRVSPTLKSSTLQLVAALTDHICLVLENDFAIHFINCNLQDLRAARQTAAAAAKSLQSCPTRCDPIDSSPLGSSVPGILQARILEWVAISFSNAWKWKVKAKSLSRVLLLATPWTVAYQAPLSMRFARQEYWSGLPLPSPEICYLGWS